MKLYDSDGSDSAPYNMALVGYAPETNLITRGWSHNRGHPPDPLPLLSLHCDKLAVGSWSPIPPSMIQLLVPKAVSYRHGKGRRRGAKNTYRGRAWTSAPGVEGGIYVQLVASDGDNSSKLRIEYNPAKMTTEGWETLHTIIKTCGITDARSMWVDRYDAAFDYGARRRQLLLDDRKRKADMFSCGPWGPETERTGFRRGSLLRAQLYDKTAERRAANPSAPGIPENVTRYELQVSKPEPITSARMFGRAKCPDRLQVGDLPYVRYPGGDISVRCFYFHPLRVNDPAYAMLASAARMGGIRYALNHAKEGGMSAEKRQEWLDTMLPVVSPSPQDVWAKRWWSAADKTISQLCGTD